MQIAWVDEEEIQFGLVIADDHRHAARRRMGESVRQVPGADARLARLNRQLQAIERIAGRISVDLRAHAGSGVQRFTPQLKIAAFTCAHRCMVAPLPLFERGDGAGNAFLADFHAAANPGILEIGGTYQCFLACFIAYSRTAEKFVCRIQDEIGASGNEAREIIFGRRIDDYRYTLRMREGDEFFYVDQSELDRVMRDHIERRGRALADRSG